MFQLLIVDDEVSVLDGLALTIPWQQLDIETVHRAENGLEALEVLRRHPIDIVITDIRMPGMGGLELVRTIRDKWAGIKTVILSGHGEFQYAQDALRSETEDFLLKPVRAEDVMNTIRRVQAKLELEWENVNSRERMKETLREHLPLLRNNALYDLLIGRYTDTERLAEKLRTLDIPFFEGDECHLMLIRIEEGFAAYDPGSLRLFEFAIGNMTSEIFGKLFYSWHVSDPHDYLVIALKLKPAAGAAEDPVSVPGGELPSGQQSVVGRLADQLQKKVQTYLKGKISIIISRPGIFPGSLREMYQTNLTLMRHRIGSDRGILFSMGSDDEEETLNPETACLDHPYRTPGLMHLLDAGKWDEAEGKLDLIFGELEAKFAESAEHLMEVYHVLSSSFTYISHKNGRLLASLLHGKLSFAAVRQDEFHSIAQLRQWAYGVLNILRTDMETQIRTARAGIIAKVHQYIFAHLSEDVSLQTLADHVHLHPVYLSKVYKLETGETLSDYLNRVRMDKACALLKQGDERIYRIAEQIGFDNTYFAKVFKKHFGMTPQEYRDR